MAAGLTGKISPMAKGTFRFYEELNDYLPDWQKKVDIGTEFTGKRCIKETIEDFGVPPSTVDLVLVNGKPVDFQYTLNHGDRVSVCPVFEKLNIQNVSMLRKSPLRRVRFIADVDLQNMVQFSRCLRCNTRLEDRQIKAILHRISPETKRIFEKYLLCRSCRKDDRQKNTWQLKVDIIRL